MSTTYDTTEQPVPPQTGEGDQAESPLELEATDWKASVKRAAREFKNDRASMSAAGMAFYWFLAVFPALLAAVGLLGLFNAGATATESINDAVRSVLPGDAARVLTDAVTKAGEQSDGAAVLATLVGLGIALWSASAGMVAMQAGLDVAYDVPRDRTFVKKRLVAFALLGVTAVLGGLATAMLVFGQPIGDAIRDDFPLGGAFVLVWTAVRWAVAIVSVMILFAAFYYLAPKPGLAQVGVGQPGRRGRGRGVAGGLRRFLVLRVELRLLRRDVRVPRRRGGPPAVAVPERVGGDGRW